MAPLADIGPNAVMSARGLGAALGSSGGLAAAYGAHWSGIGDTRLLLVAVIAASAGGLLGAVTWPVLQGPAQPGVLYGALFAGVAGMLAGAFAGFPVGGVFGAGGGAAGGSVALLTWRLVPAAVPVPVRSLLAATAGLAVGGLTGLWMAS